MNRQEMIEAWKKNTTVFGEMSKEMREFAKGIPSNNFFYRTDSIGWQRKCGELYGGSTYRLKSDYTEQPDEIVVEIERNRYGKLEIRHINGRLDHQRPSVAPCLSPQKGYVFLCYEFEDGYRSDRYFSYKDINGNMRRHYHHGSTPIFATKAIYVKEVTK